MPLFYEGLNGAPKTSQKQGRLQENGKRGYLFRNLLEKGKNSTMKGGDLRLKKVGYRNMGQNCLIELRKKGGLLEGMT